MTVDIAALRRKKELNSKMIDEIDAKILKDLLRDGRKKITDIAYEAQISKDVIYQHYTRMKKEGIIVGSTIMIEYKALGYNVNLSLSLSIPIQNQQLMMEQLKELPGLYDVYQWGTKSELWAVLHLNDSKQIEEVKLLVRKLPCLMADFDIWTSTKFMLTNLSIFSGENLSIDNKEKMIEAKKINSDPIKLDELDRKIIEELVYDCRKPFAEIAKKTGTSPSTIMRRYQRLTHNNIIRSTIQIDPSKIGYPANAIFRIKANAQVDLDEVSKSIFEIPDIYLVFKTLGKFDYLIFSCVKTLEHLLHIEEKISHISDVQQIEKATVLSLKLGCLPFPAIPISTF